MQTSWQSLERSVTVTSQILLCLMEGKPPLAQKSMWSIVKKPLPHAQVVGTLSGCQPYLKARASRNAELWREKANFKIGRVVSQLEAPFSWARDMARSYPVSGPLSCEQFLPLEISCKHWKTFCSKSSFQP